MSQIAKKTGSSVSTVKRRIKVFKEAEATGRALTDALIDRPRGGRPSKITPDIGRKILAFCLGRRGRQSSKVRRHLLSLGIDLSARTIRYWLRRQGLHPFHRPRQPRLLPAQKKKRLKFARNHRDRDWSTSLFTDETEFVLFPKRSNARNDIVWARAAGDVPPFLASQYSVSLQCWAGVSAKGKSSLVFDKGSLSAKGYQAILKKAEPEFKRIFKRHNTGWTYVHDGASAHKAASTNKWLQDHVPDHITSGPTGEWPANSPDFNIIEQVWGILAGQLQDDPPKSLAALKRRVKELWKRLPQKTIADMASEMKNRMKRCIRAKGGWTGN